MLLKGIQLNPDICLTLRLHGLVTVHGRIKHIFGRKNKNRGAD
jgi:hypothetical protein